MADDRRPTSAGDRHLDPVTGRWPVATPLRVGIVLFEGVEPLDAIGPAQVLWSLDTARDLLAPFAPIEVHLVAEAAGPVIAGHGLVLHATTSYDEVGALDVVVVPGGSGKDPAEVVPDSDPRAGRRYQVHHEPTLAFLRRQAAGAEVVASVCTGTFVLAAAGLLVGRRANTHWSAREELVGYLASRGEPFTLEVDRVVDDGDLVSAGGVSSGIDLALHLVDRLLGPGCAAAASAIIEQETPPLAGSGAG